MNLSPTGYDDMNAAVSGRVGVLDSGAGPRVQTKTRAWVESRRGQRDSAEEDRSSKRAQRDYTRAHDVAGWPAVKRSLSIVFLVIALSGTAAVHVKMQARRSRERAEAVSRCHAAMMQMSAAVSIFTLDCGTAPESPLELLTNVNARTGWLGPYLPKGSSMVDPWGREFAIVSHAGPGGKVFVMSHGCRLCDTNDDIIVRSPHCV